MSEIILYSSVEERAKSVAFTGHRTYCGEGDEELRAIVGYLYEQGYRRFLCGMAWGFDLAAGRAVAELKMQFEDVELIAVEPFQRFGELMSGADAIQYKVLISIASDRVVVSGEEGVMAYMRRNDFLVDNASVVVAWWDGKPRSGTTYTVKRARRKHLEVVNLYPKPQLEIEF